MNDDKEIEIYRQCMEQRKHYDTLSWTIGGFVMVANAAILAWSRTTSPSDLELMVLSAANLVGIALIFFWYGIYERNRMFVEVANELARDFERKWQIEGIGLRNGIYAVKDQFVLFKNTNLDGTPYAEEHKEKSKTGSIHISICSIVVLIAVLHLATILKIIVDLQHLCR